MLRARRGISGCARRSAGKTKAHLFEHAGQKLALSSLTQALGIGLRSLEPRGEERRERRIAAGGGQAEARFHHCHGLLGEHAVILKWGASVLCHQERSPRNRLPRS